ncbi:hypothetical protein V6N11_073727 [Hibiscus sabdariffa]|uniref:Uncharacterized protein n=1 Tax=Hibiscus sabdariffa TaxID=183260 RepID=A0ABR2AE39_9ROSI
MHDNDEQKYMRADERRKILKTLNSKRERRINRFLGVIYWYCSAAIIITVNSDDVVSSLSYGRSVQLLFLIWAGKGSSGNVSASWCFALPSGSGV